MNACSSLDSEPSPAIETQSLAPQQFTPPSSSVEANVKAVSVSGTPGAFTFSVTVESHDTGCDQYSDWWEVISTDGELLYRRVLLHSHTDEQPFTRSGGPVNIQRDEAVVVRAHMSTTGYSGIGLQGSVADGFKREVPSSEFSPELERKEPQPSDCAF